LANSQIYNSFAKLKNTTNNNYQLVMKTKLFLLAAIAIGLSALPSCVKQDEVTDVETSLENLNVASDMVTTTNYTVPVVEGYTTNVSYGGMVYAKTSSPITIKVPKEALQSRSDGNLNITYTQGVTAAADTYTNLWQTVLFEDSKKGDYDYNDIIIHVNYKTVGTKLTVDVQPIALGSTKDIRIGFIINNNGVDHIVAENCREELFNGREGFINTVQYDRHYSLIKDKVSVDLSEIGSPTITWFIDVDKTSGTYTRLYAANQDRSKCIDDLGRPYGFALTDTGNGNSITSKTIESYTPSSAMEALWADYNLTSDFTPIESTTPTVPSSAIDLTTYQDKSWTQLKKDYYLKGNYSADVALYGGNIYIENGGVQTLTNIYGSKGTIIVLPGGVLNLGLTTVMNGLTIKNFGGTVNFTGSKIEFLQGSQFLSNEAGINNMSNTFVQFDNTGNYFAGAVVAKDLSLTNKASVYAASVTVNDTPTDNSGCDLYVTNNSTLAVKGSINATKIELNTHGRLYSGCGIVCTGKLYLTNNSELNTKSYLSAGSISMDVNNTINVLSGGLISTGSFTTDNNAIVNVVGSEKMGVFKADNLTISNSSDATKHFTGNIGVVYVKLSPSEFTWGSIEHGVDGATTITAPINGCSPGYSSVTTDDDGACWFSYPMENVNIDKCYNFEKWRNGDFDFTKLGGKIFDITSKNPAEGSKVEIFNINE
jgi:hypothetical protein